MTQPEMLWIDLETTGLDPDNDVVLELGLMLTDKNGNEIDFKSWLIYEESGWYNQAILRGRQHPIVGPMHEKSGLWTDLTSGPTFSRDTVCDFATRWLISHNVLGQKKLPMSGSSVGSLDRPFTQHQLPLLNDFFTYRNIDVSTIKEICRMHHPELFERIKEACGGSDDHRVLGDIRASIFEYQQYLDSFIWLPE